MVTKTIDVTIAKLEAPVFSGKALFVTVPGSEGEMTILPEHTAIISALRPGTITIKKEDGTEESILVEKGVVEVSKSSVTILL